MAQDTNSQKTNDTKPRWFRHVSKQPELPELDHLFDLYWGGPERRITGLTLKIISVNVIALIMLLFGILYLGQYQNSIIETKLQNFQREVEIISIALGELDITQESVQNRVLYMISEKNQQIMIFDQYGSLITTKDAQELENETRKELKSVQILKETAKLIVSILPDTRQLPTYPETNEDLNIVPDLTEALNGLVSMSAWEDKDGEIILSSGAPLIKDNQIHGAIVILRQGDDIRGAIGNVWKDVLKIFAATLLITIVISIYLAGAIANPLKKLAKAAENVRTGKATGTDIPNLSERNDEIGELSVVLKSMTNALWEKMDSIESFSADVSHELKNPLTSLKSAIETLQKVTKKADREKLLSIINHDIERMDRLITDISTASRLDSELSKESFETIDIHEALEDLLEAYKVPMEREDKTADNSEISTKDNKTVHIHAKNTQNYKIRGSAARLQHVFQNLIDNALSFSKSGDTVDITINRGENLIAIHVDDHGPGIPEKKLETIFDRFYTERPEQDYGQHSGLGLSICKQIIESHRGEIFAENRRDDNGEVIGARFTVVFKGA